LTAPEILRILENVYHLKIHRIFAALKIVDFKQQANTSRLQYQNSKNFVGFGFGGFKMQK
jgi:hypothetical protein